MISLNVKISFLSRSSGRILGISAGLSVIFALCHFFLKRSAKRINEDKTKRIAAVEDGSSSKRPDLNDSKWIEVGCIQKLYYYPLKSGSGKELKNCAFTDYGISVEENGLVTMRDRMFLVYDGKSGKFQTGRNYPNLLLVKIFAVDENSIRLETDGMPNLVFGLSEIESDESNQVECSMWWGEPIKCKDCGSEPAAWISKFLTGKIDSGLRMGSAMSERRNILKGPWEKFTRVYRTLRNEDTGYFSDIASYMLMNESSLDELNNRLELPVSALQFRPNLVISGCVPFDEDTWEWIKIGESVLLRNVKPCSRCSMIRINPESGTLDSHEPLKTLRSFREQTDPKCIEVDGKAPIMGIYCGLYQTGPVKINDKVFVQRLSVKND